MSKHRVVKLKDLKTTFFVRRSLNQDHVLMLAELYEAAMLESKGDSIKASQAIQVIEVTEDMEVFDGRHRKEAMEVAQLTEAKVEIMPPMTRAQAVVEAARANYGGCLPPTRDDMIFTVEQLLAKHGMTQKAVEESMTMLPKSVVRKYINMATKRITEAKLKLALTDLANGLPIANVAKQHGLKIESIQLALEGKKPKSKSGAAQISSALTSYHRGYANQIGRVINKAIEDFRDGELPEEAIQSAINHYGHLLRRQFIRVSDWENRLRAAKLGEPDPDSNADTDNIMPKKGA